MVRAAAAAFMVLLVAPLYLLGSQASPGAGVSTGPDGVVASNAPRTAGPPPVDSAAVLRDARGAQARFERLRVRHLPMTWSGMGGTCDDRVGRMCIRHSRSDDWTAPPEDPAITDARLELLEALGELEREVGGDDWILGQRVRYLGEAGRWDGARDLARECSGATGWWCLALEGMALHYEGRYWEAEDRFQNALGEMPRDLREEWEDPEFLLDRNARGWLGEVGIQGRDRLWAMANPLVLVPGNDRWTEHLTRHTLARIHEGARNPYGMSWSRDLAEILVRYGPEAGFERQRDPPGRVGMGPPGVLGRFQPKSRRILPVGDQLRNPTAIPLGDWTLDERRARTRYAPSYAPRIRALEAQQAVFRRGDSILVVLGHRIPRGGEGDPEPGVGPFEKGLFLLTEDGVEVARTRDEGGTDGVLTLQAPNGSYLASVEVWDPEEALAWRLRYGLEQEDLPRGVVSISDLVVTEPEDPSPGSLSGVLPSVLPFPSVPEGERLGIAWEVYNLSPGDMPVRFRLRVREEGPGFLRRIGQWLRLVTPERPTDVSWEEVEEGTGVLFRAVNLDLEGLSPGRYELELSVELSGREPARATRTFKVEDSSSR